MKKQFLLTPGPTPVPSEALLEMAKPIFHHRTSTFKEMFASVNKGLQYVFKTKNPVITFASSGTGAMEASVVNFLSAGDTVIVASCGKFGERWGEICKAYGVNAVELKAEYGRAPNIEEVQKALKQYPQAKAVYATLCETSTGVLTDVAAIGALVKETQAILVVDAISGLGADDLRTDEWGVDVAVSGSQKALMLPPGLGFMTLSEKAAKMAASSTLPKFYFNVLKAKKALDESDTPFTPAVTLLRGLAKTLEMIQADGIDTVLKRSCVLAEAVREAFKAIGLKLFAVENPSNGVTSAHVPQGVDGAVLLKTLRDKYGVSTAAGQGSMKGKVFRFAHMGFIDMFDVIVGISAVEIVLNEIGFCAPRGAGVAKLEEVFAKYGMK